MKITDEMVASKTPAELRAIAEAMLDELPQKPSGDLAKGFAIAIHWILHELVKMDVLTDRAGERIYAAIGETNQVMAAGTILCQLDGVMKVQDPDGFQAAIRKSMLSDTSGTKQ